MIIDVWTQITTERMARAPSGFRCQVGPGHGVEGTLDIGLQERRTDAPLDGRAGLAVVGQREGAADDRRVECQSLRDVQTQRRAARRVKAVYPSERPGRRLVRGSAQASQRHFLHSEQTADIRDWRLEIGYSNL